MRRPFLDDLTAFLAIADHCSFRRAALALGVTPSALSHGMRVLEDRLGVRLLNRTTRSVALTEAGARLADRVRPAMGSIGDALGELREQGGRLAGSIRVSTMEYGAQLLVEQAIASFQPHHPDVAFEIVVDPALVDIVAGGFDAGIRFRDQVPPDMVAVPIAPPSAMVAVASPAYLRAHPAPAQPSGLLEHRCIRQRLASGAIYRWEFEDRGRTVLIDPPGLLTCNSLGAIVCAAASGLGVGFVPQQHAQAQLDGGRLVQLLAAYTPAFDGLCFYFAPARHPTRTFAAFTAHLRKRSAALLPAPAGGAAGALTPRAGSAGRGRAGRPDRGNGC